MQQKACFLFMTIICLLTTAWSQTQQQQYLTEDELNLFRARDVVISDHSSETYLFEHVGTPDHDTGDFPNNDNPNEISEQHHDFYIPKYPTMLDTPGCLPRGGTIAVALNGIPFFNPYSALGYNAVEGDNAEVFDHCWGHPEQRGAYHYHTVPWCLLQNTSMELVGISLDGYPIVGPKDENGNMLYSADLDECHGRWYQGRYMYVLTTDFPYLQRCYRGSVPTENPMPGTGRRRRQAGPRPPPGGGQGQGPGGGQSWEVCYAVCEDPVAGCTEVLIAGDRYNPTTTTTTVSGSTTTTVSGTTTTKSGTTTTKSGTTTTKSDTTTTKSGTTPPTTTRRAAGVGGTTTEVSAASLLQTSVCTLLLSLLFYLVL